MLRSFKIAWVVVLLLAFGSVASADRIEIDFFFPANQSEAEAWYELVDLFNASQDRILVTANWDTGGGGWDGYQERMLVRLASGQAPDIIRLSDEAFPEWAHNGYLRPLDDFLARGIDRSVFLPVAFELGTYDGQFYGFPQGIATRALAYNRSLFDEAGVAYPDDNWTWDNELLDAARRTTRVDPEGNPLTYGIGYWWGGAGVLRKDIPEILWSFGGEVFDAEGNFRLRDQGSIDALTFLASLVGQYEVYPADFDIAGRFVNGTLAMWNTGVWDVAYLRQQQGLDWDFAPTPGGPAGHYSFIQGNGVYVVPSAGNADAAWEFMQFLVSEEAQRIFSLVYGIGGIPLQAALVAEYADQPAPPENWGAFITSVNRGRMAHHPLGARDIFDALNNGWAEMVRGEVPVRTWLDSVGPVVEAIMATYR